MQEVIEQFDNSQIGFQIDIHRLKDVDRMVLEWWLDSKQRSRYPLLSRMAIDICFIFTVSTEPERRFSGAKCTISEKKDSLRSETIELIECLKLWFRLDIFTKQDLYIIVDSMKEGSMKALKEALNW